MMSGGSKLTAMDRIDRARITALANGESFTVEMAARLMEAHAAAAVADVAAQKDGAYDERNRLVAALAAVFPSALSRHPDDDRSWEDDWRWIVFIESQDLFMEAGPFHALRPAIKAQWRRHARAHINAASRGAARPRPEHRRGQREWCRRMGERRHRRPAPHAAARSSGHDASSTA